MYRGFRFCSHSTSLSWTESENGVLSENPQGSNAEVQGLTLEVKHVDRKTDLALKVLASKRLCSGLDRIEEVKEDPDINLKVPNCEGQDLLF